MKEYAKSRNRLDLAEKYYDYFTAGKWTDSEGKPVLNWKQKFITWDNKNKKSSTSKDFISQNAKGEEYSAEDLNALTTDLMDIDL